jgi:ribonuclease HII
VGRGALAGPIVAACVVIGEPALDALSDVVRDSKTMSARQREQAFLTIQEHAMRVAVGLLPAAEIDQLGIGPANRLVLEQAVHHLGCTPDAIICDAFLIEHPAPQVALIDGDAISVSVAAASIIAKVTRDRMMAELQVAWPVYGFERNVGYGTRQHLHALAQHGPCPEHRRSFAPLRTMIESGHLT